MLGETKHTVLALMSYFLPRYIQRGPSVNLKRSSLGKVFAPLRPIGVFLSARGRLLVSSERNHKKGNLADVRKTRPFNADAPL